MAAAAQHPRVGVAALVCNAAGEVILGKRKGSHGSDTWAVPGGHLEFGEDYFTCAERETLEETALDVKARKLVAVTNDFFEEIPKHYITLFVVCELNDADAHPKIMEPEKCEEWRWWSWNEVKTWAAHHDNVSAEWAENKLFLPMRNLVRDHPRIEELL